MKRRSRVINERSTTELGGVDLHTLDGLRRSLEELAVLYAERPREVREHVIAAKDRAKWAARNARASVEKRAVKAEMVEWMLVWLDDPAMFSTWVALRVAASAPVDIIGDSL